VLIVDAGPLYAAADTSDSNHAACNELLVVRPNHVDGFILLP
jgi:hypothetical protein